jgi:hypothetical protein
LEDSKIEFFGGIEDIERGEGCMEERKEGEAKTPKKSRGFWMAQEAFKFDPQAVKSRFFSPFSRDGGIGKHTPQDQK